MTGEDISLSHEYRNGWRQDYEPIDPSPAKGIVLRIDSPGGEAAGTMEAHKQLRRLSARHGVPLYAYADECVCSAAYALASAAQEIWLPPTGMVGSIGVIATLFDRTAQNVKYGINVELITSGAYKADGHADRPITNGIRRRMQARVDALADQFFGIVAKARGISPQSVDALEAGVFMGKDAIRASIADGVASWPKFLELVSSAVNDGSGVQAPAA